MCTRPSIKASQVQDGRVLDDVLDYAVKVMVQEKDQTSNNRALKKVGMGSGCTGSGMDWFVGNAINRAARQHNLSLSSGRKTSSVV